MSRFRSLLAVLATVQIITGCVGMSTATRERTEAAFRHQNQLSSDFMLAAPEIESACPSRYERLLDKEASMLRACEPLNTLAGKRRDGKSITLGEKMSIARSLDACELAIDGFEASLQPPSSGSSCL